MATNASRPGRVLVLLAAVMGLLLGLVAYGGDWSPRLGLDLQGGTRITLQAKSSEGGDITPDKLDQAQQIIASRVNGSGVAAAEVSTRGGDQIIVEIPGERRNDIVDEVGRTAQLRFRLVWAGPAAGQTPPQPPDAETPGGAGNGGNGNDGGGSGGGGSGGGNGKGKNNRVLSPWMLSGGGQDPADEQTDGGQGGGQRGGDDQSAGAADVGDMSVQQMVDTTLTGAPPAKYTEAYSALTQEFNQYTCPDGEGDEPVDDRPSAALITCDDDGAKYLLSPAIIEGTSLQDATAGLRPQSPDWAVNLDLDGDGTGVFADVSRELAGTGRLFAIVLDGQVLTAPTINSTITNGQAEISGSFTQTSATALANSLQYGALPLSFEVNGVTLAGPTLAGSQLSAGILAGIIGLILVVVYCMFYYRGLGLVVIASLGIAAFLTYELVILLGKGVGFTLTLPGIAGLIVAVGITADSFIIFFERLRDEVREGKSLRLAVEAGWKRARATILAADAVSLLAAVVLYTFAIDEIRGFAFALGLTTVIDAIVVFVFTKPLVTLLARTKFFGEGHKLSGLDAGHLGIEGRRVTEFARTARRPQGVSS
ncbi:protein translocase subunit SecD [soil metagenome]